MNIDYLVKEIFPLREMEIKEGKNCMTRQPIYVVLDLQENYVSGHSDFSSSTNYKNLPFELGYVDLGIDGENRTFKENKKGMIFPEKVTRFFTDRIIAFFLTAKGASDYLVYQSHNLNNAYVYIFYSGYGNKEMDNFLGD